MVVMQALEFAKQTVDTALATQFAPFVANKHKIERCYSYLCDEESRINYSSELSFLMLRELNAPLAAQISPFTAENWQQVTAKWPEFAKSSDCPKMVCAPKEQGYLINMLMTTFLAEQYQYGDIFKVDSGEVFIDCGACFGDTALWAYKRGAEAVYSFEPSPYNFDVLKQNIKANDHDENKCFNLAVGAERSSIPFAAAPGMAGASHIDKNGNIQVECVPLDAWLEEKGIKPTFLKFDIEGAEVSALQGARKTITALKPKIAICLYHQISDMWNVPLLLKEMLPEYRFYCRKNNVTNEFILYALV